MSMTKRILAFVLAALMVVTFMAGCGKDNSDQSGSQPINTGDNAATDNIGSDSNLPSDTTPPPTESAEPQTTPEPSTDATTPTFTVPSSDTSAKTDPPATDKTDKTDKDKFSVEDMSATMYATDSVNVRSGPGTDYDKIGGLKKNEAVTVTGRASTGWYRVIIDGKTGYVSNVYLTDTKPSDTPATGTQNPDDDVIIDDGPGGNGDDTVIIDDEVIANLSWVEENGWGYMATNIKDQRFLNVIDQVMTGIKNLQTEILVEPCIMADEAESFANLMLPILAIDCCYVKTITATVYAASGVLKSVKVQYYVNTKAEADKMVQELRNKTSKVISNLKSSMSDYEKIKYLNDWLVLNCTPDQSSIGGPGPGSWESNAYGSIVDGHPTCLGYAKGLLYLLHNAGYEVCFAEGIGVNAKHIWVKVKLDGNWYNIDPTWCDPISPTALDPNYIDYNYFLVDDNFMAATHKEIFDMTYFEEPAATATKYNWHRQNGLYASSYDEALKIIKDATKKAVEGGSSYEYVRIRFADKSLYDRFSDNFKKSAYNSEILADISSKYTCQDVLPLEGGWCRTYRLIKK